jgi:uncharacterized protein YggE
MMMRLSIYVASLSVLVVSSAHAQVVQVNRANKTIEVSASATLRVEPELAQLRIGYKNYAATQQAAIEQNVQASNRITRSLLEISIPKDAIETETIRIDRTRDTEYEPNKATAAEFVAVQEWIVIVSVSEAEKALEMAIRSGANMVQEVTWAVNRPEELMAKANSEAIQKARTIADQMAKQMSVKVGDLLYVSNTQPEDSSRNFRWDRSRVFAHALPASPPPPPLPIHLFAAKVEQMATVTAVFAMD